MVLRIGRRSFFSKLVWTFWGELATSTAQEEEGKRPDGGKACRGQEKGRNLRAARGKKPPMGPHGTQRRERQLVSASLYDSDEVPIRKEALWPGFRGS